ncbi:MAG TPA: mechanosensitive ion channel family protein [Acidimicrobiales bacterium]|nr:mechanosensitive ion channel family protein [Acidimicrobiales bacterium]
MNLVFAASFSDEELAACGVDDPSTACVAVYRWTSNELLAKAADWFVAKPLTIALVIVLAIVASRLLARGVRRFIDGVERQAGGNRRVRQRAETIGLVLRSVGRAAIWIVALMTILGEIGLDVAPLIAGAGIAGVALGFGAQTVVKDFLSGMFMLVEDQFGVGDFIDVGEASGKVEAVTLRTTRVRSVDGTLWHVPNGTITRIGNKSQEWSRALLDIEVAYSTDIEKASTIIKRVADATWHDDTWAASIVEEPEVWGVESLGASGVVIRTVLKTVPADQWKVMRELRKRIKEAFDAEGIEIPFPQQTIWVRGNEKASPFEVEEPDGDADENDG